MEAIVCEAFLLDACQVRGPDRPSERIWLAESRVVDQDDQHVWCAFRRLRPGDDRPIGHRLVQCAPDRPAECPVGDWEDSAVRAELLGSFCQGVF